MALISCSSDDWAGEGHLDEEEQAARIGTKAFRMIAPIGC